MFWGLLKVMVCMVSLPLRIIMKATKVALYLGVPILLAVALKKMMRK